MKLKRTKKIIITALVSSLLFGPAGLSNAAGTRHRHYIGHSFRQQNLTSYSIRYRSNGGVYQNDTSRKNATDVPWPEKTYTDVNQGSERRGGYPSLELRRTGTVPIESYNRPGE